LAVVDQVASCQRTQQSVQKIGTFPGHPKPTPGATRTRGSASDKVYGCVVAEVHVPRCSWPRREGGV